MLQLGIILAIYTVLFLPVFAFATPGDLCFENVNDMCGLTSGDPATVFAGLLNPLEALVPGFAMVIFWGGIMAIVWFKTENIMLLGLIGVFVNATISGISAESQGIGLLLLGVANGILLFQLVRQRVSIFS